MNQLANILFNSKQYFILHCLQTIVSIFVTFIQMEYPCLHVCTVHQLYHKHFVVPTDAHCYEINRNVKTIYHLKIITLAPTCFGSRRNHHQGAVLCLAKTTNIVFLCSSVQTQSRLWRHISLLCRCVVKHTPAQQADMAP